MKNLGNAKAQFSRQQLLSALISLMQHKAFHSITIEELTQKAQLTRRTFYRNFSCKEDVLLIEIDKICSEYRDIVSKATDLSIPNVAYYLFQSLEPHYTFLQLLHSHTILHLYSDKMDAISMQLFEIRKHALVQDYGEEIIEYALLLSMGGFGHWLKRWLNPHQHKSADELKQLMAQILLLVQDQRNQVLP